jgi:hypothetical protein
MHFVALSGISSPQYGHFLYPSMVLSIDDGAKVQIFQKSRLNLQKNLPKMPAMQRNMHNFAV